MIHHAFSEVWRTVLVGFLERFCFSEVLFHHICIVFVHMDDWTRANLSLQLGRKRCRIREPSSWRKKTSFVLLKLEVSGLGISNAQLSFLSEALLLLLWSHIAGSACLFVCAARIEHCCSSCCFTSMGRNYRTLRSSVPLESGMATLSWCFPPVKGALPALPSVYKGDKLTCGTYSCAFYIRCSWDATKSCLLVSCTLKGFRLLQLNLFFSVLVSRWFAFL